MNSANIFMQLLVILGVSHCLGRVSFWLGQPAVIGYLLTGVIVGPMVLGAIDPGLTGALFANVTGLMALGKIGLIFIMFGLGLETGSGRHGGSQAKAGRALPIAVSGFIGAGLAGVLLGYASHGVFSGHVERLPYMLFFGVAMAATAVPVLAGILDDPRFLHHRLAPLVMNAAVITDILAWFALSLVLVLLSSTGSVSILYSGITLIVLVAVAEFVVSRRLVAPSSTITSSDPSRPLVAALIVLFTFCVITDLANAHVTIGAFIAGIAFRRHQGLREFWEKGPQALVNLFFAPLFFGTAAMNVNIEAGNWAGLMAWGGLFLLVGALGKAGISYLVARCIGLCRPDAIVVATLMHTKGVMEIILLTVGLEIGVITADLYAILMVVALAATIITLPIVRLVPPRVSAPAASSMRGVATREGRERPVLENP